MSEFTKMRKRTKLMMSAGALGLLSATNAAPALAQQTVEPVDFDIPSKELSAALKDYSIATDQQVIFAVDLVRDKRAPAVSGAVESGEALSQLLKDTGLSYERTDSNVIVIKPLQQQAMLVQEPARVAVLQEVAGGDEEAKAVDRSERDQPRRRDEITVTGTLIKGIAPESSPVLMFDREDILKSGASSTEDFIRRALPQNFDGGSTEIVGSLGLPDDTGSQYNATFGSGANLRGLGSRATLSLLNGNRIAPTSSIGDFVDLSMIPVTALERVDILTDGASSLYGADAVAGVINFIIRDDFEGSETSVRYGTVTEGGLTETRLGQTLGASWESGNILGSYEFSTRGNLRLSDRPDIQPLTFSDGTAIIETEKLDLLPEQSKHNFVALFKHSFADKLDLSSTASYSNRTTNRTSVGVTGSASSITAANSDSESISLSFSAVYNWSDRWTTTLDTSFSKVNNKFSSGTIFPNPATPIASHGDSNLWTAGILVNGDLLNLPGGAAKLAVGAQVREEGFDLVQPALSSVLREADRSVAAGFAELYVPIVGEGISVPGVQRLEVNLSGRLDDYSDFGTTVNPKVGIAWWPAEGLKLRGSYGTSFVPPALGLAGANDRFAGVAPYDWIRGILGIELPDPSLAGVNYIITGGTSEALKAEESRTFTGGLDFTYASGDHSGFFNATYYDIRFTGRLGAAPIPGNLIPHYAPGLAFENPAAFPEGTIVFFPNQSEIDAVLSSLSRPLIYVAGLTQVENIGFINNVQLIRNLAETRTRGLDFNAGYSYESGAGTISAKLNANYILEFSQQASSTTPSVNKLNTLYNPVDLQLRGQLGYLRDGLRVNLFVNYIDSYRTNSTPDSPTIGSWTTVDVSASYDVTSSRHSWLGGVQLSVALTNAFDQNPPEAPLLNSFRITGYDPANASPLGRFVSFEVRKSF